jgi:ATP synthase protein I
MANPPDTGSGERPPTGDLAKRIARARGADQPDAASANGPRPGEITGIGRGYRLATEFVAAILVGAGLGWGIDAIFKTQPWGIVIFLLLGFVAGVLNVVRATADMNARTAVPPDTPALKDDDDE